MTSRHFAAFCLRTGDNERVSRFGFTVPKALGSAVIRNRLKRRTREAVSAELKVLSSGWAIVFNPRKSAECAPFSELRREVNRVFARCSAP